ncbi:MAG: hypothetical protein COA47_15450 [Robiginitomaculum sp.]|nr:MAG: hypothetical protein COA47_15450 [Robiginitomaculum sp.]
MTCSHRFDPSRRGVLKGAAGGLALALASGNLGFSAAPSNNKLVVIILHGGMDGLNVVVPTFASEYYAARPSIAIAPAGETNGALALSEGFGLHPALAGLAMMYDEGQLAVLHAASAPYQDRSHFDGLDVLENGTETATFEQSGWLNRALGVAPALPAGLGIGSTLPLILKGEQIVPNWAAPVLDPADPKTVAKALAMYGPDPVLQAALQGSVDLAAIIGEPGDLGSGDEFLARAAGKIMSAEGGPGGCSISFGSWDTHANQGGATGTLAGRLGDLDAALLGLREEMGAAWDQTVVLVATEFGRTVQENGTGGTDHGVGGVSFVLGGAVKGGRILGDWPGLAANQLLDERDLFPANDLRSLFKGVLRDHWGVAKSDLNTLVFPDSADTPTMDNLLLSSATTPEPVPTPTPTPAPVIPDIPNIPNLRDFR